MCNSCSSDCKCQQKTIKLEVGKTYLNRKGSKVTILEETNGIFCGKLHNPLFNIVYKSYHSDGRQGNWSYNTENTLVWEYHEPEYRWMNYYGDRSIGPQFGGYTLNGYISKAQADASANSGRTACIRIDINTGEVCNEKI